jgi:hypothetical protein
MSSHRALRKVLIWINGRSEADSTFMPYSSGKTEIHHLFEPQGVFQRRLNIFFRQPDSRAAAAAAQRAEADARAAAAAATARFESARTEVLEQRSQRRDTLNALSAGRTAAAASGAHPIRIPPAADASGAHPAHALRPGARVEVVGLVAAPQYNGRHGVVRRADGDRLVVDLDGAPAGAAGVRIKPANLRPLDGPAAAAAAPPPPPTVSAGAAAAFTGVIKERF